MKFYIHYTSPLDDMAFDALRGMVLVHNLPQVEFCKTIEECDSALLLVRSGSNINDVLQTQEKLRQLGKPYHCFHIHGQNENFPDTQKLGAVVWDEKLVLDILKTK